MKQLFKAVINTVSEAIAVLNSGKVKVIGSRVPDGEYVGKVIAIEEAETLDKARTYFRTVCELVNAKGEVFSAPIGLTRDVAEALKESLTLGVNYTTPAGDRFPKISFGLVPAWAKSSKEIKATLKESAEKARAKYENKGEPDEPENDDDL